MTTLPPVVAAPPPTAPAVTSAALYRAEVEAALLKVFLDMPVVSATVVARTPQGATVIATARGEVTIPDGPDLPPGTEVAVRIVSQSPLTISLRAQPRAEAPTLPTASPAALVRQGPVIEATLVRANEASPPSGARIPIRILAVEVLPAAVAAGADETRAPATAGAPVREIVSPTAPMPKPGMPFDAAAEGSLPSLPNEIDKDMPKALASPAVRTAPAQESARPASSLPTMSGARETARTAVGPAADGRHPPAVSISASAEEQVGRVIHQTPGAVVLRAPVGLLSVQGLNAPEEALVRFVFAAPTAEPRERTRSPVRHAWAALGDALRVLETSAPGIAERLAADVQPRNPESLAANVRLLAAAQRQGAPPPLAAEIDEALTASGHPLLADELRSEIASPRLPPSGPAAEGWQVVAFPIHDGASLRPAQLYIEEEAARRRRSAETPSRFILEVGTLQFDGLLRPRRFDLLLRSRTSLRDDVRSEIERIFRGTIDACGWTGEIAFSTVPAFPVGAEQLRVSA